MQPKSLGRVRFGLYEFDLRNGELRREGTSLRLQPQPAKVLGVLLSHAGEVVGRQQLAEQVWGSETFVDFEQGLNYAIRQIRTTLEDDADHPRFLETLPKRGYRFIAPVVELNGSSELESDLAGVNEPISIPPGLIAKTVPQTETPGLHHGAWKFWPWILAAAAGFLLLTTLASVGRTRVQLRGLFSPEPKTLSERTKPIRSLAVLPLVNLTGDPSQENLADGMTDALIANLAQIRALKVISRTSAMSYKGTRKPLPQIARELGVDAVVEGSVVRQGNRIRVTGQLILAATDEHLWAESFDRELHDVLVLQNDVARAISEQVKINLTPAEAVRLSTARGINPEAYQSYLWGRFHVSRRSPEGVDSALTYFQDAIGKDPSFAPGYAGLAESYAVLPEQKDVPFRAAYAKAKAAALHAVQL
ncbi:MAG TPA: winged helix-turn-helix domain-containing protein, partial [Terriglobales bacterium]